MGVARLSLGDERGARADFEAALREDASLAPSTREFPPKVVGVFDQVRRDESLRLFQRFFRTGSYWQDSLLARYTLAQTPEDSP